MTKPRKQCQSYLRGDATNIKTSATERATLLDAGGLEAELRSLDGGNVAARTTADDDDVVLIGSRSESSGEVGQGVGKPEHIGGGIGKVSRENVSFSSR